MIPHIISKFDAARDAIRADVADHCGSYEQLLAFVLERMGGGTIGDTMACGDCQGELLIWFTLADGGSYRTYVGYGSSAYTDALDAATWCRWDGRPVDASALMAICLHMAQAAVEA